MPSRQPSPSPSPSRTHFPLAPPIAAGSGLCSAIFFLLFFCKKTWGKKQKRSSSADSRSPRRFSYAALKKATSDFSERNRIGRGGSGSVYAGTLPGRVQVAVKVMDPGSLQGEREFTNELLMAEKIDCERVVKLLGFVSSKKHMMLVYELMSNGSLQDVLLLKKDARVRVWEVRFLIALDVARGIEYLHSCDPCIVHCDVKPSNVLLDGQLRAKIGDFGLARFEEAKGKQLDHNVVEDVGSMVDMTESVTTRTSVGIDDFSGCMDQSPESVGKGLGDERSPRRESQVVGFPNISEGRESVECSSRECEDTYCSAGVGLKEIVVQVDDNNKGILTGDDIGQHGNNGVKEYVMEWIGAEIGNERTRKGWIGDSLKNEVKTKGKRKKKQENLDWWPSLDEDNSSKKIKRRPATAREWWKEEYARDLIKKQKKKKRRQPEDVYDEYANRSRPQNEGSNNGSKYSRNGSKRSRGSLDWWLDGLSGESWRGLHNSHDSGSQEFARSGAMSSTPSMRGTLFYVAPEYGGVADNVNFSNKCDIYSYGVLLLVIIAGRRPLQVTGSPISEFKRANLISWSRHLARAGKLIDLVDKSVESVNQEQALCCIKVALLCLQKSPALRPSMKEVVLMLSGDLSLPELPSELSPSTPSRFPHTAHKKVNDCPGCLLGIWSSKIKR